MNKAIVEMNVKGETNDGNFHGILNAYPNTISKLGKKPRLNLLESFKKGASKIPYFISNVVLSPRVLTMGFAIIIAGSLSACTIVPDAKVKSEIVIETVETQKEATYELDYTVKPGDNLWNIASKYYSDSGDIANEVSRICAKNNLDSKSILRDGTVIKIAVPYSSLEQFGYTTEYVGPSEWDMMDYFVRSCFDVSADQVHPDNLMFWRDKEVVVSGVDGRPSLLQQAARAKYTLEEMEKETYFYDENDLNRKKAEIDGYYVEAIEIAERNTNNKYGVDFLLEGEEIVIPLEEKLVK